jgi:hypothetical protein
MKRVIQGCATVAALILPASSSVWGQKASPDKHPAGTESIGDAVQSEDKTTGSQLRRENTEARAQPVRTVRPIHILYMHGIHQVPVIRCS